MERNEEGNASEEVEWTKGGKNNRKISVREISVYVNQASEYYELSIDTILW